MIPVLEIKNKVTLLKQRDPNYEKFGASFHKYDFNEVLSPTFLEEFERINNIHLPKDYSDFLLNVGNGGPGPNYGLLPLMESIVDFKLENKPKILINQEFRYHKAWNELWIEGIDWEKERPDDLVLGKYMDVCHIYGSLQICHFGHGCSYLLVINGNESGNIWFDGRADYSGIYPESTPEKARFSFIEWYMFWLNSNLLESA